MNKKTKIVSKPKQVKNKPTAKVINGIKNVHNLIIVDSSGSMEAIKAATLNGIRENLETLKVIESQGIQKQLVSLYIFNTDVTEWFSNQAIGTVAFKPELYVPSGFTALNDAIGHAVNKVKLSLRDIKDTAVIVTIFTDGEENASKEFSTEQAAALLKDVQTNNKWVITYVGANQDLTKISKNYNIATSNMMNFSSNVASTNAAFSNMRSARMGYAKGMSACSSVADLNNANFYSTSNTITDVDSIAIKADANAGKLLIKLGHTATTK